MSRPRGGAEKKTRWWKIVTMMSQGECQIRMKDGWVGGLVGGLQRKWSNFGSSPCFAGSAALFQTAARLRGCLYSAVVPVQQLLTVEMSASGPMSPVLSAPPTAPSRPLSPSSPPSSPRDRMQSVSSASAHFAHFAHFAPLVTRNRCILAVHKMPLLPLRPMK